MKPLLSLLQTSRSNSLDDGKMVFYWQQRIKLPLGNFSTGQLPIFQLSKLCYNYRSLIIYLDEECSTKYCLYTVK